MIFHSCKKWFCHASKIFDKNSSPSEVHLSEETMYKILIEREKQTCTFHQFWARYTALKKKHWIIFLLDLINEVSAL